MRTRLPFACAEDEGWNADIAYSSAERRGILFREGGVLMRVDHVEKVIGLCELADVVSDGRHSGR